MILPDLKEEKRLWKSGFRRLAGVDEVGRGALAGPVVACAVLIKNPRRFFANPIFRSLRARDSKLIGPKEREYIYRAIRRLPELEISIASVSAKVIDRINIRQATIRAMKRAVGRLGHRPDMLLIDGVETLPVGIAQRTYVKGDGRHLIISLASICAKVSRDARMKRLAERYPAYGFGEHKGYGTRRHRRLLRKYGPSKFHRLTFTE